ncbi:MAG: tetratricopeptide repeat protein [Polyangiales bacterium]
MAALTVSNYLGMLQADPHDEKAIEGLREAVASGDPARLGEQPQRLIEIARGRHEQRGEFEAAAGLIDVETGMVADDPEFLVALYRELARLRRQELLDDTAAVEAYRKVLEWVPNDLDAEEAIEQIEGAAANWKQIVERFSQEAESATEPSLKASLYTSAAGLVWQYKKKGKNKDVDELFEKALQSDPGDSRAARLYALTLRQRKKPAELAALLKRAAENARSRDDKVSFFVQAARSFAAQKDQDQAAECFQQVQDFVPGHEEALSFLVEYFTEREDWDHLVALYEDALKVRQKIESEQGILLQIGMVHWRMRGRADLAEPYFARLRKIEPAHPGMLQFYREFLGENDPSGKLLTILGDAQRVAGPADEKVKLAVELARAAQDSGNVERAIEAWKAVQRADAQNAEARDALKQLYRRGEKWNALVEILKQEADSIDESEKDRKVEVLRELVGVYRENMRLDVMVINTYNAILQVKPDDAEALDQLSRTFEAMGRWNDLIQVLGKKAEAASDKAEKVALFMRVAQLWVERFANYNKATEPLEAVLEVDPANREAIEQLKEIYTKKRAWKPLFDVQRREADLEPDADKRLAMRVELAKLASEKLHRYADAISLYREIVAQDPTADGALDALEKLSEREKDWAVLTEALEKRAEYAPNDAERIKILTKAGTVYGEHLGNPSAAASAWKRVLRLDPKNGRALRTLREAFLAAQDWDGLEGLYAEAHDWEGLVDVLGAAAERADDPKLKVALSFRAAAVFVDRIGEPHRAFRNYERILSVEPKNAQAAAALAPIYEREEKWPRLVGLLEVLLDAVPADGSAAERLALISRIRDICLGKLNDPVSGFLWAVRGYEVAPTEPSVLTALERAADAANAHDDLAKVLLARLPKAEAHEQLALRRRIAALAGERLGKPEEAITQLREILAANPRDAEATAVLDRLYRREQRHADLASLYEHRLGQAADDAERYVLLGEIAELEEKTLGRPEEAAQHYRSILEIDSTDANALAALDRLADAAGRYTELANILGRRHDVVESDGERLSILVRLGDVYRVHLARPDLAIGSYEAALQLDRGNEGAVRGLEALIEAHPQYALQSGRLLEAPYTRRGEFKKLHALLESRLAATQDEEERRELRLRLADLSASELGDPSAAYSSLEAAFLDRPHEMELWDRLAGAAEAASRQEDLAKAYALAIESGQLDDADAAELARRVADVYDVVLGRPADAESFHKRVLSVDPLGDRSFLALKELYTNQERWDDLQSLYRVRIAETVDGDQKLELLLQVCFLFEEILDDPERAIVAYQEVLDLEPSHAGSRKALDRLYRRTGRWRELLGLLRHDLDQAEGPPALELTYEIGTLHEQKLSEPQQAVDSYELVLQKSPSHQRAQEALERLLEVPSQRQRVAQILEPVHESQYAWAKLAHVLDVELEFERDPGARVALLTRLARIREERLQDLAGAFDALARAVEADPGDAEVRKQLARIAMGTNRQRDRAAVLEKSVAAADATYLKAELLGEIAALFVNDERDLDSAESAFQRLIAVDPENAEVVLDASRALERIHLERGNHAALVEDLRRQVRFESSDDVRKALLVRLGDLLELSLEDVPAAIAAHNERLELDPSDLSALSALERLYQQTSQWEPLIEVLEKREALVDGALEQRDLVFRVGTIRETQLGDVDGAIGSYNDVLSRFGRDPEAMVALARLYEKAARWQDLYDVLEMQLEIEGDANRRAELRFRCGELLRTKLGAVDRAIEAYMDVLAQVPGHAGAVEALEDVLTGDGRETRVSAAKALVPHYQSRAMYGELVSALCVAAETDDPVDKLDSLRRAAEVADVGLGDAAQAFDLQGRSVRVGLSESELGRMLADLERLARAAGKQRDHVALLVEIVPDIVDGDLQVETMMKIARTAREELGDVALSKAYYAKVLEFQPEHRQALDALDQLHRESGDHASLLEVVRRKAEIAESPAARVAELLRVAQLCEESLSDLPSAIDALEQVLSEQAVPEAWLGLERLYTKAERFSDLAGLYERMLDAAAGPPSELRYKLGRVHLDHLRDPEMAIEQFRTTMQSDPGHLATIETLEGLLAEETHRGAAAEILEPVYMQKMQWPKLAAALEARLTVETELTVRKDLHRRLGQLHEDYREDLPAAMEAYARLFREDPTDKDVWEILARLARAQGRFERLADIYAEALSGIEMDEPATAELAGITARLYDERVNDAAKAAPFYARALRFDPTDRASFDALESVYRRTNGWDDLLGLYRERVDVAESDAERVSLLHRIAGVEETQKENVDAAIDAYRQAVEIDPQDRPAVDSLDRLFTGSQRWQDLADLLRFRVEQSQSSVEQNEHRHRLGQLLAGPLEDYEGALDVFEEVVNVDPLHGATIQALEQLVMREDQRLRITQILEPIYRRTDEWMKLIAIWEAQVELTQEAHEKARLLGEIGRMHETRGRDAGLAFHAWARAFAVDPHDETARGEIDRIAGGAGAWNELVEAYERGIAAAGDDAALVSQLLATVARIHDEKRGDPRSAIETYERLLAHDPNDPSPLDALEALHTLVGDWNGLVDVLGRKVELTYDATERAELLRRMGSVLEELIGDSAKAVEAYAKAAGEDPQDPVALEALDRLYATANEHSKLAEVLERRANVETDDSLRIEIWLRLAQLAETQLASPERAIEALTQVTGIDPRNTEAIGSLVRLYERKAQWSDLLDVLRTQAEMVGPAEKVAIVHRTGEVLERRLDDVLESLSAYEQALSLDPRHEPSIAALLRIAQLEDYRERAVEIVEPLLRDQARWDDLASVLSLRAETAGDPLDKRDRLRALAEVHERGRNDKAKAFEVLGLAFAEDASDESLVEDLERLATELGSFAELADALASRASTAPDPEVARSLYVRLARIAEQRLGDDVRAIEAYSRALEQVGDDPELLLALDRLHQKTEGWSELAGVLERRVDQTSDPAERAQLLVRLGRLRLEKFEDQRGAFAAFRDVVEAAPDHLEARSALESLVENPGLGLEVVEVLDAAYRQTGALDRIPALYEVRIARAESSSERVGMYHELAQLEEQELRQPAKALAALRKAFELDPRDTGVLAEIERLADTCSAWDGLRGLVEAVTSASDADREMRRELNVRAAGWYTDKLGDHAAAEACLRAALAADVETPEAHEKLVALLRAPGRAADLVAALRAWAESDSDEFGKKERLREAARIAEAELSDHEIAGTCLSSLLDIDGGDVEALADLSRIRAAQGRHAEVAELLVRRIDVEMSPEARLDLRRQLAALYAGPLDDVAQATDAYRGILDEEPTDLAAMSALEQIYEKGKKWDDLRDLIERRLDVASTDAERIAARVRLARLSEQAFGKRAEAMSQLREILEMDPSNEEALDELERLLAAEGQWDELVEQTERRIASAGGEKAVGLLVRLAAIHGENRKDAAKAIETHERILSVDPRREASLRALVAAHEKAGDSARTADALDRLLPVLGVAEALGTCLSLAKLAEEKLGDAARAEGALRRALSLDASHEPARSALKALFERHGRHAELAEMLGAEAEALEAVDKKVDAYKRIASIHLDKLGDAGGAAAYLERASKLVPEDREILLPLCDLYIRAGRGSDAVPVLRQIIASFGTKRTKEVATYHHRLGNALEAMGDLPGALEQYDAAFKVDLTSVAVLRDLGRITHQTGDFDRAQKTFRALLLQKLGPDAGISKGDVYFYLGDISAKQGDKPKAISMLERAIAEDKGHAKASELLAQLKG